MISGQTNGSLTEGNEEESNRSNAISNEPEVINECGKTVDGKDLNPVLVEKAVKVSRAIEGRSEISLWVSRLKLC